jgi:hypothetical protein
MSLKRMSLVTALALAIAACFSATVVFGASKPHKAKSHKVKIKIVTTQTGTKLAGTWSDAALGKGTATGTLVVPLTKLTLTRTGGGSFSTTTYNCPQQKFTPPTFAGCWKVVKGTGKFKGMTGKGLLAGTLTGPSYYTGPVKY